MKQENKQGVTAIRLFPKAYCFCPLGDDWYTNEFEVIIYPDKTYPDYCDIEEFLNEKVRGKALIIEDATRLLYDYIEREYSPNELQVISRVSDAISHSPVEVIIK